MFYYDPLTVPIYAIESVPAIAASGPYTVLPALADFLSKEPRISSSRSNFNDFRTPINSLLVVLILSTMDSSFVSLKGLISRWVSAV